MPSRIALCGLAGSGKSTAAAYLVEKHGFKRLSYAFPIKRMLRSLLIEAGAGFIEAAEMTDGKLKEIPTPYLAGKSPRYALQTLGTEWGRDIIATDIWRRILINKVSKHSGPVVVDDLRFPNEAEALRDEGFLIISVRRPCTQLGTHSSETQNLSFDKILMNNGDLDKLHADLDSLFL